MEINWVQEPESADDDTQEIMILPSFQNDTRRTVTMVNPAGHVVGEVRIGSIIHRVMIANGYKVFKS
jgi:hypothetical protein